VPGELSERGEYVYQDSFTGNSSVSLVCQNIVKFIYLFIYLYISLSHHN